MKSIARTAIRSDLRPLVKAVSLALLAVAAIPDRADALDARALGLGGSSIAHSTGVRGALDNPAALMRQQRDGEGLHLHMGFSVDVRDEGDVIETLTDEDNEDLADDIDAEIDQLSGQNVTCNPLTDDPDTECLSGTAELGSLANRLLDLFDDVDEEDLEAQGSGEFGIGMTSSSTPFAVHLRVVGTGQGRPDIADGDNAYIGEFGSTLEDNSLTLGELTSSSALDVDGNGQLTIDDPEDVLTSEVRGSALLRTQVGISVAHSFQIAGQMVDIGVTPKFSTLRAGNLETSIADVFDDDTDSLQDQFEDSENEESSFTVDVGAATTLPGTSVQLAVVARNLIAESVKTDDGFEFETTPQLIVGGSYALGRLRLSADLALNSAEVDNFETQPLAIGLEYDLGLFALRGGIAHDSGRDDDATALSAGFDIGPLQVGARLSEVTAAQAAFQLAFTF